MLPQNFSKNIEQNRKTYETLLVSDMKKKYIMIDMKWVPEKIHFSMILQNNMIGSEQNNMIGSEQNYKY